MKPPRMRREDARAGRRANFEHSAQGFNQLEDSMLAVLVGERRQRAAQHLYERFLAARLQNQRPKLGNVGGESLRDACALRGGG